MRTREWQVRRVALCAGVLMVLVLGSVAAARQTATPAPAATKTTWYFYTVKWGSQDEFLDLFQKNHYPLLKAQQQAGRFALVRTWVPQYHGDGRADWTFVVELVSREAVATGPTEQELITRCTRTRQPIAGRSVAASNCSRRTGTCRSIRLISIRVSRVCE